MQHRNDNTYINTETSSAYDGYESYGSSESSDIMELAPSVDTGADVESITAAEQEALPPAIWRNIWIWGQRILRWRDLCAG